MKISKELQAHYRILLGLKKPWQIDEINLEIEDSKIEITVSYEAGKKVPCPECGKLCIIKDHREKREWRHLDTMQFATYLICRIPRSYCPEHGIKTIITPWSEPGSRFTMLFEKLAIDILKATKSIKPASQLLNISWAECQNIQQRAVNRGIKRRNINKLEYLGIDEKSYLKHHKYASILIDIANFRVIDLICGRNEESASNLLTVIPEEQREEIKAVAADMWEAYTLAVKKKFINADIVHDKFHISKYLNKAVDDCRKVENKNLKKKGIKDLVGTKYLWLKNSKNWLEENKMKYEDIKRVCIKTSRAWAIKETFNKMWQYKYKGAARNYFKKWYFWATHSRIKSVIETAKMLNRHLENILTYCDHKITNSASESINSKIQNIKYNARGFRNFDNFRTTILFYCGKLDLYPQESL